MPPELQFLGISLEGWLTIAAIILGPILAVQAQKWVERKREERVRKLFLFRELMATRAARLSQRHVEALNLIDLEYDQTKPAHKPVQEAWRSYLDALGISNDPQHQDVIFEKRNRAFIELMYQMGKYLKFPFDRVAIERNVYSPIGHGKLEDDQELIRKGVVELLTGKRALSTISWLMPGKVPIGVVQMQEPPTTLAAATSEQPKSQQPLLEAPAPGDKSAPSH